MKIAIHHSKGSFSDRWIYYCKAKNISYKLINAYDNDIIQQLEDCSAFMWQWHHGSPKDILFARQLTLSLEHKGINVFPNSKTAWHFDDKVGQKYLLEAIEAPLVKSYVFYEKKTALEWANKTSFPKVFKLRGGSGASNVRLAKTKQQAIKLINKAFGKGFTSRGRFQLFKYRFWVVKRDKNLASLIGVLKGFARLFIPTYFEKVMGKQLGYVYFQNFIDNNDSDIRVIVIGDKAFAIKRYTRAGDFRASGSGVIEYLDNTSIDVETLKIAFKVNKQLSAQCLGYDFVYDNENNPLIVEISYGFDVEAYDACLGYWDNELNWHEGSFVPQEWMVDLLR